MYAAEQIYSAGNGDEKFAYVAAELEDRGFKVDTAVIEAAVREMNLLEMWDVTLDVEAIANGGEE